MEDEGAAWRGAGDVAARGDGRSRVVDGGGTGDPVLDAEREADDSWWVPVTFSQGIIGARREGVAAPLPSPISLVDTMPRSRSGRATTSRRPASARANR
jgi:hypothetical protein